MTARVGILAKVRRVLDALAFTPDDSEDKQLVLNNQLELLVAEAAAYHQERVRAGRALWVGTAAALAAVVARPTTAAMLALQNQDKDDGRTMVIDWVAALNVVSTAVVCQAQLLVMNGQLDETTLMANAGLAHNKHNGNGTAKPDTPANDSIAALPAATGVAANWMPFGPSVSKPSAVGTPGYGLYQRADGEFMVPPGRIFAMHVQANVVGETFLGFIGYHHKQLSLG